jgi:hypothetical protein
LVDKSFEELQNDSIDKTYGRQNDVTYDEHHNLKTFPKSSKKVVVD